ncbi:MAG: anaerobic ribonucleoside-triphosphate reductase activating protein [Candidatus Omnitrophica bacterium]|nr:anaerobic ribonucleoside-triphosphate reductase activating protein [Candidatus Omnitrophota bacterium]
MLIGGLLKFSLIDYPGKVAAVIFTQGCNYRCPFCHNPALVLPELFTASIDVAEVMAFLHKRRGQLQGIVITGGEPTLHPDLKEFIRTIKQMGFLVKLDTNGSRQDVLKDILSEKLVDYVAMDIKSSLEGYCKASGVAVDLESVKASIALIKASGVDYSFRTTAVRNFVSPEDLKAIGVLLDNPLRYKLQRGNLSGKVLDPGIQDGPHDFSDDEWAAMQNVYAGIERKLKE